MAIVVFFLSKIASLTKPILIHFFAYLNFEISDYLITTIAFLLSLFIIYLIGVIGTLYIGKLFLSYLDKLFLSIPFIKNLYSGTKQIIDAFTLQKKHLLKEVVLVEYPRKGLYAVGFLTNKVEDTYYVFLPTTPNPTSGWLLILKKEQVYPLNISMEEAVKLIVSGGIFQGTNPINLKDYVNKDI
ncbi:MAG: DUF502 domain-containing protein [Thermoanaerobaculia bacterium]